MSKMKHTLAILACLVLFLLFWTENQGWQKQPVISPFHFRMGQKVENVSLKTNITIKFNFTFKINPALKMFNILKAYGFSRKALRYNRANSLQTSFHNLANKLSRLGLLGEMSLRSPESILSSTTLLLNGVNELSTEQIKHQMVELNKSIYKDLQVIVAVPKDKLLKVVNLNILEGDSMFYANIFYHISEMNRDTIIRLCLECSSEIQTKRKTADESEILQFLKQTQLSTMILNNDSRMEYTCEKIGLDCSIYSRNGKKNGMFRPRCCIMELHYLFVRTSEVLNKHNFPYELDGGTVLGAVKFSHTLPWEQDHDYEFRLGSKAQLLSLRGEIEKLGYRTEAWGNYVGLKSKNWHLEANGVGAMMSDFIALKDNTNIGQFARSRYGVSCLKHAWHWIELGRSTSHIIYEPGNWGTACKTPGHHTCSDNYICDGSLQFEDVW